MTPDPHRTPDAGPPPPGDPSPAPEGPPPFFGSGEEHLRWIGRFMLALWPAGAITWLLKSPASALVFAAGGLASLAFWYAHAFLVGRMLDPSVPRRWIFAVLALGKLALIVLVLRAMMGRFPTEATPLATGLLLFVAAILLEALRLALRPAPSRG